MALLPPPPTSNDPKDPSFRDWFYKVQQFLANAGNILFTDLDFTGSNITSILTRNHADLQNLNTASYTHLTSTQATDLTDAGDSTLHYHASDRDLANATGTLVEANGGTGETTYTNGQLLVGNASNGLTKATLTEGSNITITNGDGSITIATANIKIYEPIVNAGFNLNVGYIAAEPLIPDFMTDSNGDIMMAWGGEYQS